MSIQVLNNIEKIAYVKNEDFCLFKLDSYLNDYVNIGDLGILNITMSLEDLKKKDFSNVSGYWDCF